MDPERVFSPQIAWFQTFERLVAPVRIVGMDRSDVLEHCSDPPVQAELIDRSVRRSGAICSPRSTFLELEASEKRSPRLRGWTIQGRNSPFLVHASEILGRCNVGSEVFFGDINRVKTGKGWEGGGGWNNGKYEKSVGHLVAALPFSMVWMRGIQIEGVGLSVFSVWVVGCFYQDRRRARLDAEVTAREARVSIRFPMHSHFLELCPLCVFWLLLEGGPEEGHENASCATKMPL